MELVTIDCDLTADPLKSPETPRKSSISIKLRRFRRTVYRNPDGEETIKEHRLMSPPIVVDYEIYSVLDIDSVLNKSTLNVNNWIRNRVSDLVSSKAANLMSDGKAYSLKAQVDVIFKKRCDYLQKEIEILVEEDKNGVICLEEISAAVPCTETLCSPLDHHRCTEIENSHVLHRDYIWKWLSKFMPSFVRKYFCHCFESD